MCVFSAPKPPPSVDIPTPVAAPPSSVPDQGTAAVAQAGAETRRRRIAQGQDSTLVNGGAGLAAPATTANKSLYGQ